MRIFKYLLFIATVIGNIQHAFGNKPWDIVLMDVSSDMDSHGANGVTELDIANHCIKHLKSRELLDYIMLFAGGRVTLPVGDGSDIRYEYRDIRRIIGDGTSINDALTSCLGRINEASRILVISNGREVGSSISSNTLSKLMKLKGVQVDAIIVSSGCDSICVKSAFDPKDSVSYERTSIYPGLNNIVNRTEGKVITIKGTDDIDNTINVFLSSLAKKSTKFSGKKCNLNAELSDRLIARIRPQKVYLCEVDTSVSITYNGIKFHGLADILNVENMNTSILIDHDVNRNSRACNIVFFSEPTERDKKHSILQQISPSNSYCKLDQTTPIDILPMIYYNGIGNKMKICGLEYEEVEE